MNTNAVAIVEDPTYLAREINYNHQQVVEHGKSMLVYAADAGRGLIAVKGMLQHGEFKAWVKANCTFSYEMAARYMRVAKNVTGDTFDATATMDSIIDAHANRRNAPIPTPTDLSQDDASHALKLQALVDRGATEGERDVAWSKLNTYAKGFGMAPEELVTKAQDMLPDWQKSPDQIEKERYRAEAAALRQQLEAIQGRITQLDAEYDKLSREELKSVCIGLVLEREGLTKLPKERKKAA